MHTVGRCLGTFRPDYMIANDSHVYLYTSSKINHESLSVGAEITWPLRFVFWFLARPIFGQDDRADTFLRNVCSHKTTWNYIPDDGNIHSCRCETHILNEEML
jgi:hypothetical protein